MQSMRISLEGDARNWEVLMKTYRKIVAVIFSDGAKTLFFFLCIFQMFNDSLFMLRSHAV